MANPLLVKAGIYAAKPDKVVKLGVKLLIGILASFILITILITSLLGSLTGNKLDAFLTSATICTN